MDKKTALTLGAVALLSAGTTFGIKIKQKKDFEKTLKTVLIPDAEKELEALLEQDAELQDSLALFQQLLSEQSARADAAKTAQKHNNAHGIQGVNVYSLLHDVSKTLKQIGKDWRAADRKVRTQKAKYHLGQGEYDYEIMPQVLQNQEQYVEYGMTAPITEGYAPIIPGGYQQYYESGMYNDVYFSFDPYYNVGDYVDTFVELIRSTKGGYTTTGDNGNRVFYGLESASDIQDLVVAIKYFATHIDNSQGVINPQYLASLNQQLDALVPVIDAQIKLENDRDATAVKVQKFKSSKAALDKRVVKQKERVKTLKTTDVKTLMKQHKKTK